MDQSMVAARFIGGSVTRKEDRRLLSGQGVYVDDIEWRGMLHGAFLRSNVAKGTILSIDAVEARRLEGVVAVFTAADFEGMFGEAWHAMLGPGLSVPPPLAVGDVCYVGDPIALVVAESRYVAEDALELIEVELDVQRPVVDYRTSAADSTNLVHGARGLTSNAMVAVPFTALGDVEEAFATAAHVVTCDVEEHRYLCVPMETRGIVASWVPGREEIDIVCSCQSVHATRDFFARYLRIPEGSVRVTARDVGGGFGQKMFTHREECAVALATRSLGRPVKWIEDRYENLVSAAHSRNEAGTVRLAIDDDQVIQAIAIEHVSDIGAYPPCPGAMKPDLLPGPYKIPRLGFSTTLAWTNTTGRGAYRGPWLFETTAREMAIDHAARVLGIDPVALRRKNLLAAADLPFRNPGGLLFQEVTPLETLEQALEILDYEAFRADQAAARAEGRMVGLGISCYIEPTSTSSPTVATEGATVRVETNGEVTAFLGTTSHGQSIETTMAQVVADTLGVHYDSVTVVQADTQSTPFGPGTGGSRTAVVAGGAVRQAALAVRQKIVAIAAHHFEAAPDDIEVRDGTAFVTGTPSKALSMQELADAAYRFAEALPAEISPGLEATERFRPTAFPTWSNATHLCVVEIDRTTLVPRVVRYIVSEDCGTMINPTVVEGQIFGGVVQGIGGVLYEDFVYDADGNPLTTTFLDYLLPTTTEVPSIEVGHISTPASSNPGGHKGMGEGGAIGSHAAVANAVGDALAPHGVHVLRTPLGPSDIHRLLVEAGAI